MSNKTVNLLLVEWLLLFSPLDHILMQTHLIFLHKEQQSQIIPAATVLLQTLIDSSSAFVQTDSQQRSYVIMPDLVQLSQQLDLLFIIRNFLDDILQFSFTMDVAPHEVFASANQLLMFELFKRVEIERLNRLTYSYFHNIYSISVSL